MIETNLADSYSRQKYDKEFLQWVKTHRNELPTPLYLYSEAVLQASSSTHRALFPANARGFYALKANPQPALVSQFARLGIGGEVTGQAEWELCIAAGLNPANILAGGVVKSLPFLEMLCQAGPAAIVVESEAE